VKGKTMNSGKYKIEGYTNKAGEPEGRLVNIATGVPIPDDEPVFILRAKDILAIDTLEEYTELLPPNTDHFKAINNVRKKFNNWRAANQDKIKEPD
jgi:hypothetical protein